MAFKILIPISCILLIIFLFKGNRKFKDIALKLGAFGLAIFLWLAKTLLDIEIPKVAIRKLGKKKEEPAEIEATK